MTIDETGSYLFLKRRNRKRKVPVAMFRAKFQLAGSGAGAAGALHQVLDFGGVLAREQVFQAGGVFHLRVGKDLGERAVDALDGAVGGDRDDAGGDTFEDGLDEAAAAVELAAVGFQLLGHPVEAAPGAYAYILQSLKPYPAQQGVADAMRALGLTHVTVTSLLGGVMSIHYAEKRSVGAME